MIKEALLIHGTSSTPDSFWFPKLSRLLAEKDIRVHAPQMPDADAPTLTAWGAYILENYPPHEEMMIIGHSAGAAIIPYVLSCLSEGQKIARAILVAGFARPIPNMPDNHPMLMQNPDWDKIKSGAREFIFIHSTNDPWGCDHHQGEFYREKFGGHLLVMTDHGHFGSRIFNQPYADFPILEALALLP